MSGIKGQVTYVGGPAQQASHHLESGTASAYTQDGRRVAISHWPEGQGYLLRLSPGTYRLVATSGDAMCPEITVTVIANQFETVPIRCSVK
jgi:hypothetical protein